MESEGEGDESPSGSPTSGSPTGKNNVVVSVEVKLVNLVVLIWHDVLLNVNENKRKLKLNVLMLFY
jgi:hypothetical protein